MHTLRSVVFALTMLAALPLARADDPLAGDWAGALHVGQTELRLVVHIKAGEQGYQGTLDSLDQGVRGLKIDQIQLKGDTVTLGLTQVQASFKGTLAEGKIDGEWTQRGVTLPLVLEPGEGAGMPARPQEPKPPFPYQVTQVTWRHVGGKLVGDDVQDDDAVTLAGTLTRPPGEGPFPAALLVTGSGPQDRDETLLGHKPFLVLADHLTRAGFAVLRYDDRGVGGSHGPPGATTQDLALDALSGVRFLLEQEGIHPDRVGVIGHSEGGLIAPMVATQESQVAFCVLLAGPGVPGREVLRVQSRAIGAASGATPEQLEKSAAINAKLYQAVADAQGQDTEQLAGTLRKILQDYAASLSKEELAGMGDVKAGIEQQVHVLTDPWFRYFLCYDPRPTLQKVRCPLLALNGAKDLQVDAAQNLPELVKALEEGGCPDFAVMKLPGLNHLFQTADTGAPMEYARIEETFAPLALTTISDWLRVRFLEVAKQE